MDQPMKGDEGDGSERETRQEKERQRTRQLKRQTVLPHLQHSNSNSPPLRRQARYFILFYFSPTCQTETHPNIIVLS